MNVEIFSNDRIASHYYRMQFSWETGRRVVPGQFLMLRISEEVYPLLRRPFGIFRLNHSEDKPKDIRSVEIIYKIVGKGTAMMSRLVSGDQIDVVGPLGNGFTLSPDKRRIIMVAGGVGMVPFYMLSEYCLVRSYSLKLLFGGGSKNDLPALSCFEALGIDIDISTDKGDAGFKGTVTELLEREIDIDSVVYACGPQGMLREVSLICRRAGAKCYVSLETAMACGIGACLGCAVKVCDDAGQEGQGLSTPSYKMACVDGPVFDAEEIVWDIL